MTDLLARIAFSEDSDFLAQALAPGLPMLDGRKLAYQVLLGWFGDMLAEPELDEDGVHFYVQSRGQRLKLAEHALATQSDLDGHLAGDYDRLKKALFDVRPVSPSERLIFNRLEPPIVKHDGFLYRVRPTGSSDRLVWCWGFQRRRSMGDVMLCPHDDCSLLFVREDTSVDTCPRCERALFQQSVTVERRTTFPAGAVAATVLLSGLVGATYWIASVSGDEAIDPLPALAAVTPPELDETDTSDEAVTEANSEATDKAANVGEGQEVATTETVETEVADELAHLKDLPEMPEQPEPFANRLEYGNEPLRPFAATAEPRRLDLPGDDSLLDEPPLADRTSPEVGAKPVGTAEPPAPSRPAPLQPSLPEATPSDADTATDVKAATDAEASPKVTLDTEGNPKTTNDVNESPADEPRTKSDTATSSVEQEEVKPEASADNGNPVADKPGGAAPLKNPESQKSPESPSEWSSEYVAAYQRAIAERRFLIMLFREPVGEAGNVSTDGLPDSAGIAGSGDVIRVVVPTTMPVPGQPVETAPRLLDHRSFRHLQGEPGIAVVDLTRTDSPNFGRVVSAFPGAAEQDSIIAALQPSLSLPEGTISQRSLLLGLRTGLPKSAFTDLKYDEKLNDLANRNARYMAHLDQTGLFEPDERRDAVRKQFGDEAQVRELVFATDSATTIQSAASQAVEHWRSSGELESDAVESGITAYGLELFQSPASSRWFATLLIVTE